MGRQDPDRAGNRPGHNMVSTAGKLAAVTSANADARVLGLFAKGNMAVRWEGALATHTGGAEAPIKCTDNPDRTADHAHSSQITYPGTTTPGLTRSLTMVDGETMTMAYGTAEEGGSQGHTGTQLRIAAYGPGAANVVGLSDQTDLFFTVTKTLALDPAAVLPMATPSASPTTSAVPSATAGTSPTGATPSSTPTLTQPDQASSAAAVAPFGGHNGPASLALTGTTAAGWVVAAMALLAAGFLVRRRARASQASH